MRTDRQHHRAGLTLVEVVISSLLVGMLMVSALKCVGAVIRGRVGVSDSGKAGQLARQLLSEIIEQDYEDPNDIPVFGPETLGGETLLGPRNVYDDVDDFDLWSQSPPVDRDGVALPNMTGWTREVSIDWVDPADPSSVVLLDQGVKRITVTIRRDGNIVAQESALRSDKYPGN